MISTTLACADSLNLERDIRGLERGGTDWFHIDIMDGHFVPNLCLNFDTVKAIRRISKTPMDVHLMVSNPMDYVDVMAGCGIEAACAHTDSGCNIEEFLNALQVHGIKKGIALAPKDPVESVFPYLQRLDYILLLFVNPGFSGQRFQPEILSKLDALSNERKSANLEFVIEVDGGVGWDNAVQLVSKGADLLVAGAFANFDRKGAVDVRTAQFRALSPGGRTL